jgi:hypothetical protein
MLRAGDADGAERLMKQHIYEGRDFLIARFRAAPAGTGQPLANAFRSASPGGSEIAGARAASAKRAVGSGRSPTAKASRR